ncbi:MAG: exonuclease SbcCD subunit D [Clostridia bacterium]|nr:exonuclease SbcCD subunit D [Clostridia bacterium]
MKLLHTSDWHLGASEGTRSLAEDQAFFINEICRIIAEKQVDAVLIAGDVFDRSIASAEAIALYDYAMTRICADLNVPALVIAGNHDGAERLASCQKLLRRARLYVAGSLERGAEPVGLGNTEIFLLPWITEAKVKSVFPEKVDDIKNLTDAYAAVTDDMRQRFTPGKRHIILSHAFITDSETSTSDRAAEIGFASQVDADVFEGFDYAALGHIHKAQSVNARVRYSGTPMPYSFGKEETQIKSVMLIDTETMLMEAVPLALLHKRSTLTGTLKELLHPACTSEEQNGYVRVRVTDTYVGLNAISELRTVYPNLIEVSGLAYEGGSGAYSISMDEFEILEQDPLEIFRHFCRDEAGGEPDGHMLELFRAAVKTVEDR